MLVDISMFRVWLPGVGHVEHRAPADLPLDADRVVEALRRLVHRAGARIPLLGRFERRRPSGVSI